MPKKSPISIIMKEVFFTQHKGKKIRNTFSFMMNLVQPAYVVFGGLFLDILLPQSSILIFLALDKSLLFLERAYGLFQFRSITFHHHAIILKLTISCVPKNTSIKTLFCATKLKHTKECFHMHVK